MSIHKSDNMLEDPAMNMTILVVDDEIEIGKLIADVAKILHFDCIVTANANDFMTKLNAKVSLIIMDLKMPDIDGVEILRLLKDQHCKSNIILMSGVDKDVLKVAEKLAKSLGLYVVGRLQKPFRQVELEKIITSNMIKSPIISKSVSSAEPLVITENLLQLGLERNEFIIHYQSQADLSTNRIIGLEALVRWQHPEYGLIFPDNFIPNVESFNMIEQLDLYVAKRAISEFGTIFNKKNGSLKLSLTLSLNLSSHSFQNLKYPDVIANLANKFDIDPANIIIEVTESGLIKDLSKALDIFTRLRMKNIRLSIDDFGTGYAMMEQLRLIPATELKIDKSLIQDMLDHQSARIMTLKIIEMGHELEMSVLAEGVKTLAQVEFLKANHCDRIQGYLLNKPLPLSALLEWLKNSPKIF